MQHIAAIMRPYAVTEWYSPATVDAKVCTGHVMVAVDGDVVQVAVTVFSPGSLEREYAPEAREIAHKALEAHARLAVAAKLEEMTATGHELRPVGNAYQGTSRGE